MWKQILALALLVAFAQATVWSKVRPTLADKTFAVKKSYRHGAGKIIGGIVADAGQFPYVAGVVTDGASFCGGVLITDYTILTAADCVNEGTSFEVHLGAANIFDETEAGRVIVTSTKVRVHEAYEETFLINDIAVIELASRVPLSNTIKPARLPTWSQNNDLFEDIPARIAGWGFTIDDDTGLSPDLLYSDVTTIFGDLCENYFGNLYDPRLICIDTFFGQQGHCDGDTGGPLIITEDDGEETVIGVANFVSFEGCQGIGPQGFARLSAHLDWLEVHGGVVIRP